MGVKWGPEHPQWPPAAPPGYQPGAYRRRGLEDANAPPPGVVRAARRAEARRVVFLAAVVVVPVCAGLAETVLR